jgi:hypothetical protein
MLVIFFLKKDNSFKTKALKFIISELFKHKAKRLTKKEDKKC